MVKREHTHDWDNKLINIEIYDRWQQQIINMTWFKREHTSEHRLNKLINRYTICRCTLLKL